MLPLHSRSLQKLWLPSLHPARGPHPHCHAALLKCCGRRSSVADCCRGLQFQDPTSAFSNAFAFLFCASLPVSCLLKCSTWLFPALQLISWGFHGGAQQSLGSLRAGSSLMLSSVLKKTLSKWTQERSQTCTFAHIYVCFTVLFELHLSCQNDSFLLESCSPA